MKQLDLIENLLNDLNQLRYGDSGALDALIRRSRAIIRRIFGDQNPYEAGLDRIPFRPMVYPVSLQTFNRTWQSGVSSLRGLYKSMREALFLLDGRELQLAASGDEERTECYVALSRIQELRDVSSGQFDLTKLIALCEELNECFANKCYLAIAALVRVILDHVPPIFGQQTFAHVVGQYGNTSFKSSVRNLDNSSRLVADAQPHLQARRKETLPTRTQIDFRGDLDVLLGEITRILQ